MRRTRQVLIVGALVALTSVVIGPAAISKQSISVPDSPRFTVLAGDMEIDPGEPFHLLHGYDAEDLSGLIGNRFEVHVFMDGTELAPTEVGCAIDEPTKADCDKLFVWDFPEGLQESAYFGVRWIAPCATWIGFEWDGQTVVESCVDNNAPMTNLIGDATLFVGESPDEGPTVTVSLPSGNIHGSGFIPFHDEAQYQIAGTGWIAADRVTEDGSVDVFGAASEVVPDDVVEMRIEGDGLLAQLTIVQLTYGTFDEGTATGVAAAELEGRTLFVCWDNNVDPGAIGGCTDIVIGAGIWEATELPSESTWTNFIQLHDQEGDIQEVVYTP
jgi:hypothetical protein